MKIKVEGLAELDKQIAELRRATGKAAVRKALRETLEPLRAEMSRLAPRDTGLTEDNVVISAKMKRGKSKRRKSEGKNAVTLYVGPNSKVGLRAQMQEFGTFKEPPQPFVRPAWDKIGPTIPEAFAAKLRPILAKAVKNQRRRIARGK